MQKLVSSLLSLFLALFIFNSTANSALKSARNQGEADPKAAFNPKEDAQDLELPMPNGLKLVLRAVAVPGSGPLDDREFSMGLSNPSPERGFYERSMPAHISAAFRQENLPKDWQARLPQGDAKDFQYYFLGKYELSNAQWDAVMGTQSGERGELPKTNISWYDLQDFLHKYNEWLLANHPDKVPAIDGVPGFLRLPNEVEWEFAARGGNLPPEQQEGHDFVGDKVEDYAVFGSRYDDVRPIGSKKPNNLGIYDLAGNAAELVRDGFRFTISDRAGGIGHARRLHGAEGGLISKGGSFLASQESDVYPGRRVEARMFVKNKDGSFAPLRDRALGARLTLASLNVPGSPREKTILQQENKMGAAKPIEAEDSKAKPEARAKSASTSEPPKGGLVTIDPHGDPVVELEKIYEATPSPITKSNLDQLKMLLKDVNEAFTRERDANLLNTLRSVAYMADSLANIAFRCYQVEYAMNDSKGQPGYTKEIEKKFQNQMASQFKNLQRSTNIYRVNVRDLTRYPKAELQSKISQLRSQYAGDDKLNENFRKNLDALSEHINFVGQKGMGALKDMMIWERVIPGKHSIDVLKRLSGKDGKSNAHLVRPASLTEDARERS